MPWVDKPVINELPACPECGETPPYWMVRAYWECQEWRRAYPEGLCLEPEEGDDDGDQIVNIEARCGACGYYFCEYFGQHDLPEEAKGRLAGLVEGKDPGPFAEPERATPQTLSSGRLGWVWTTREMFD